MDTQKTTQFVTKLITLTLKDKLQWKIHNSSTYDGTQIQLLLPDYLELFEPAFELFLENKYWILVKYSANDIDDPRYNLIQSLFPRSSKQLIAFDTAIEMQRTSKSQDSLPLRQQLQLQQLQLHGVPRRPKTAFSLQVCDEQGCFQQEITSPGLQDLYVTIETKVPSVEIAVNAIMSISE